jgi:hypothetical protein
MNEVYTQHELDISSRIIQLEGKVILVHIRHKRRKKGINNVDK